MTSASSGAPATAPHVLVIAFDCDGEEAHPGEPHDKDCDQEYSVECPGVEDSCREYLACQAESCQGNGDGLGEDDGVAHGVEHRYIAGQWMLPTDRCYIAGHDQLPDAASDLSLAPGRHPVEHDVGDGTELYLYVLKEPSNV